MKRIILFLILFATAGFSLPGAAGKKALTNADVVKMVKAGLDTDTIVLAIRQGATAFDTSPDALIALKSDGVSGKVIDAMLAPHPAAPASAMVAPAAAGAGAGAPVAAGWWGSKLTRIDVNRVFLLAGGKRHDMKYTRPGTRTRALFFGGVQQFAVLGGRKAELRITDRHPVFEMILPNNVEPGSVLALGRLGVRRNGTREILIGGGYLSFSAGLPHDRNVPLTFEKARDQSMAPEGYLVYDIKPATALIPAEYAFMVVKGGGEAAGTFGAGASASYNFYDFGVD